MKKFLSAISMIVVIVMLSSLVVVSAEEGYTVPNGAKVYNAPFIEDGIKIDGVIGEGEYGEATRVVDPIHMSNSYYLTTTDSKAYEEMKSEYVDFYFANDDEYIYIAFEELGAAWDGAADADTTVGNALGEYAFRCNYYIRLGFNPESAYEYLQFGGANTSNTSTAGPGWRVLYKSKEDNSGKSELIDVDLVKNFLTEFKFVKTLASDGTIIADGGFDANGNANSKQGQYKAVCELKINKEAMLEILNENFEKYYEDISEVMYMSIGFNPFRWNEQGTDGDSARCFWQYLTTNIKGKQAEYAAYGLDKSEQEYFPGVVLFEQKKVETTEAPTEAPATEAPTQTPDATNAPEASAEVTDAATEPTKGGCGASVSIAGVAMVMMLGTCATFISKKR